MSDTSTVVRRAIDAWHRARNTCTEDAIHRVDQQFASQLGFRTLAALHGLRAELEAANSYVSPAEVIAHLAPAIHLATGEATTRLRESTCDAALDLPGIAAY